MNRTLTIKIDTDNAAFEDEGEAYECARILRIIVDRLERSQVGDEDPSRWITLRDINGNDVGRWKLGGRGSQ